MSKPPDIKSVHDLKEAVPKAVTAEDRAHLHAHAVRLGATHHIPHTWCGDGSLKAKKGAE